MLQRRFEGFPFGGASFGSVSLLWPVLLGTILLTCTGPNAGSGEEPSDENSTGGTPQSELQFEGTVQYRDIEGGVWVIEAKDGTMYEPKDLPVDFEKDGLQVCVWADRLEGQASIRMVGPIISIVRIERRDTGD